MPSSREQVKALHDLDATERFDFWTDARAVNRPVDIMCSAENCDELRAILADLGIAEHSVMIANLQEALDGMLPSKLGVSAEFTLDEYHTYDDIQAWLKSLAQKYSDICEYIVIGKSYEGREMGAIKISGKNGSNGKKAFWMDAGIHAREWITTATVNYMLAKTLEGYGSDDTITSMVDGLNIYYVPILNPDGYDYTWTKDRMQRKTMMPNSCSAATPFEGRQGTDPNRNWDFHWGEAGTSTDPCSDAYQGANAADQPEVAAVQDFIREKDTFLGYINFHAYSQLWMSPWGWTSDKAKDFDVQNEAAGQAVAALEAVHGTKFDYGPISTTIYPASGSSADYTYGKCNVLFSYGVELRDTGNYGFTLPADQIVPSGEETFESIKALAKYMIAHQGSSVIV
jgi:murein tripeptide amidase MpaA